MLYRLTLEYDGTNFHGSQAQAAARGRTVQGELEAALAHDAEAILLDNMTPEEVRRAVERVAGHTRRVPLEASGGINLQNVRAFAEAGVDYISVGALTHSPTAVDLSLRLEAL